MQAQCTTPKNHPHPALRPPHTPPGSGAPRRTVTEGSGDCAPPDICPTCGRALDDAPILAPCDLRRSGLLALLTLAHEALYEVQAAVEQEVGL